MDFGGFILAGLLGVAFVFFLLLAILTRSKFRTLSKPIVIVALICLVLFVATGCWIFYIYGLNEPLAIAAGEGDISKVARLLKFGASPNAKGPDARSTALTAAAESGRTEVVKLLLQKGADPSLKDGEGHTPIECAQRNLHFEIAQLLQEAQRQHPENASPKPN